MIRAAVQVVAQAVVLRAAVAQAVVLRPAVAHQAIPRNFLNQIKALRKIHWKLLLVIIDLKNLI